ncbi:Polygalacturonase-inhibiting protein [Heracleum sosnowskyi]|uniref:Polygalacturonase-inhibiting protein n=1 Tax=Heracleum sosnowskyi TaxID=360622 RepID=A0AAD8MVA9_9APIA|nr:Polygalacturonase-inhibiting protein [Heracleum sosnowskyi]
MKVFIIFLFYFFSLSLPSYSKRCNPEDEKVLLQIKLALDNPYHLASWIPDTECCNWYCVDCDPINNRINALTIFQANISGQIPAAVGDLPFLDKLIFRHITNITGEIPSAIAKLSKLRMVRLSWTNLTGPVPSFFSKLTTLTYLDLSFNQLTGSIPPSLSLLPNLGALHLDRNRLTGTIPESFGAFTGLSPPDLFLSHNQLSGPVPKSLGNINFSTIDFSRNRLAGDISFLFGKAKTLQGADFSRNLFEFDISKLEFPETLSVLDLNHNILKGSVPVGLTTLENLQQFNVSYNRLCGQIPVGGKLQSFTYAEYFHNRCLCGAPLPAC